MYTHVCEVCSIPVDQHLSHEKEWPPVCCPGCGCGSYEEMYMKQFLPSGRRMPVITDLPDGRKSLRVVGKEYRYKVEEGVIKCSVMRPTGEVDLEEGEIPIVIKEVVEQ